MRHLASQPLPLARRAEDPRLHDELVALVRRPAPDEAAIAARVTAAFGLAAEQREALLAPAGG